MDGYITKNNAQKLLEDLDKWENHQLLQENRAYVITKHEGIIQIMYTSNQSIEFDEKPLTIPITPILDTVREKCYRALGKEFIRK